MVQIRHPTSAETCTWGKRLAAMLAIYTSRGVVPEVNLRECISRMPLQSSNKAEATLVLKPREDVTRSLKQGYQWPQKWTCVQQKFKKKKKYQSVILSIMGLSPILSEIQPITIDTMVNNNQPLLNIGLNFRYV